MTSNDSLPWLILLSCRFFSESYRFKIKKFRIYRETEHSTEWQKKTRAFLTLKGMKGTDEQNWKKK